LLIFGQQFGYFANSADVNQIKFGHRSIVNFTPRALRTFLT